VIREGVEMCEPGRGREAGGMAVGFLGLREKQENIVRMVWWCLWFTLRFRSLWGG